MPTLRIDLTRPRPGMRIHRSVTLTPAPCGGAWLALHVGRAEMGVDLSHDDMRQLAGIVAGLLMDAHAEQETTA